jgi:alkylation response protein AidB-like acyl-CoA dehydrogenase
MNAPAKAAGFAGVGYAEAIARVRTLVPVLRERAPKGEAARVMSDETTADLHRTGLLRTMSLCTEAVDMLHAMAGANGIYDSYPIQRIFRDAHALVGHIGFNTDAQYSTWGLAALGGEIVSATL